MRRCIVLVLVWACGLMAVGCGSDDTETADCPPSTTGATSTTTLDPRCVVVAEEPSGTTTTTTPPDEIWEGTVESLVTVTGPGGECGNPVEVSGDVRLVVAPDGSVTGTYDVTGCGVTEPHANFTGTVTSEGFTFPELIVFTNGELIPKVSPQKAEARLTNMQGPAAEWVTEWDLVCVTC